ncbi:S9 family peptidase [Apibacter muscae]|uniref:Proline-specific endopeptidase n=1 Tax=Apibacter muscae TaxID=2509004 RepID=A0A563DEJ2_9FLAO|nr:S9 family peptidase [Apibacter muscae]TWP28645.1 S9 family peptidase [Apibacter muscae]
MNQPKAKKIPKELKIHQDIRIDNYYWLNNQENPEVIQYLEQENKYTEEKLESTEELQRKLFKEMKSRIKEEDESAPYQYNGYLYKTRYQKGAEYPIYVRRKDVPTASEEIMFNVNELAQGYSYYHLGGINISPNNQLACYSFDSLSRRIYTIRIKDLETQEILQDQLENTTGNIVWANDNQTLFYSTQDLETLRPNKIFKHQLGTPQCEDTLIYEEKDETFNVSVAKTKSMEYLIIASGSTVSDEYRIISADQPNGDWQIFQTRERNLEYSFDHFENHFYILTNKDKSYNFKLMKTPVNKTQKEYWQEVIPHRENILLENFELFKNYLVTEEREKGLVRIFIESWNKKVKYFLPLNEEVYTVGLSTNLDFNTDKLRYKYCSLTTPWSDFEFDMNTQHKTLLKQQEVLGDFNPENYETKRLWATARDGIKIPISIVRKKTTAISNQTPLLLYGYGSYGYSIEPTFSSLRLSLLDRGFIYAIAHVRGGEDLGRLWYEDGKMLKKKNTFFDFIDCAKFLINNEYTSPQHLYANGGSAGGLLMGAVINIAPEIFHGVVADVPFVDVVTTMLDESIPLTTGEYDEWGNPNDLEYYEYMKSYSPYDNVETKDYPNLLVTTGLHDSQVQYWEPAKWVAKLRELKTDSNLLLLHTNMDAGHGGASGRFESLKEVALEYSFYLLLENKIA